jgi:hypothetical protein
MVSPFFFRFSLSAFRSYCRGIPSPRSLMMFF